MLHLMAASIITIDRSHAGHFIARATTYGVGRTGGVGIRVRIAWRRRSFAKGHRNARQCIAILGSPLF